MALTPETLPRHELVGLHVEVVDADDPGLIGIAGRIVRETMRTLSVECTGDDAGEPWVCQVPKAVATFEFALTDEAAGTDDAATRRARREDAREGPGTESKPTGEDSAYVTVDGARLLSRPANRTETRGDTIWESD